MRFRRYITFMQLLSYLWPVLLLVVGCDLRGTAPHENRETGPDDVSVVPEMLVGARYRGRTGGHEYDDLTWIFDETHFRIVARRAGLPADLRDALLPADVTGYRIDGRWSVEGEVLTVSELAVDGKSIDQPPRTLRAMCTPVIRIQADRHQYMFARGTAESAWSQGDIPPWPPETTRVSGRVSFDRNRKGWLSVGYRGVIEQAKSISDSATLNWKPDDSGHGWAQQTTHAPRICRLQLNGERPATIRCMGLPSGVYLFYAQWRPADPRAPDGKIVAKFQRWRLNQRFRAKWVVVEDRPAVQLDFDLLHAAQGEIKVHVSENNSLQSVFLLPWGQMDSEPPPLNSDQAWRMARWAGHQIAIEEAGGTFEGIPEGRYRLFLVEHDQPAEDGDTFIEYRVTHDKTIIVRKDAVVEVSF